MREEEEEVEAPSRFRPSAEWLAAFHREYSGALALLVADYAMERAASADAEQRQDRHYPRELVMRVLTDTLVGVVRWDHTTPLRDHVVKVIRNLSRINWKRTHSRAKHGYRHLYIEATNASGRSYALEEVDRVTSQQQNEQARALDVLRELAAYAVDDPDLLAYLFARCQEESPTDAARLAGLSPDRYRRVRRRLAQLLKQLPLETSSVEGSEEGKP